MSINFDKTQRVRVWKVENKGKYGEVQFSSGRKDKRDDTYKNSSWSFVRFIWKAFDKLGALETAVANAGGKGVTIVLTGAGMTKEPYEKGGETVYPQNPQLQVFDFEFFENEGSGSQEKAPELSPEDDIPFQG